MRARLCVPFLHHGVKTGTLWILHSEDGWSVPLLLDRLTLLGEQIDTLAALQYDKADPQLEERGLREAVFQRACRADPAACEELASWPALYALDTVHALVCLTVPGRDPARRGDTETAQLRVALHQTLAAHSHVLATFVQDTHTTVLARSSHGADTPLHLHHDLAAAVRSTAVPTGTPHPVFIGVSGPLKTVDRLPDAYEQAVQQSALYDRLHAADATGELLHTLEVYYDSAGVDQVAKHLHLHRTSL